MKNLICLIFLMSLVSCASTTHKQIEREMPLKVEDINKRR